MGQRRYYALWIPSLNEQIPDVINPEPASVELSDIIGLPPCKLRCEVELSTKNITLYYSLDSIDNEKKLSFTHLEAIRSGLISYEVNIPTPADALTECLLSQMHHSIYHYLKGIFHEHNYHEDECDSLLQGYTSTHLIKLSDSKTLKNIYTHYLTEYQDKLNDAYMTLSGQLCKLQETTNVKKAYKQALIEVKQLKRDCQRVMGEASYAEALLEMSRFNVKNAIYNNLRNRLSLLEILREKCYDAYSLINNEYNNRLGRYGIWVGAAGIILTFLLEIYHTSDNTPVQNKSVNTSDNYELTKLINRADSLAAINQQIIDSLQRK